MVQSDSVTPDFVNYAKICIFKVVEGSAIL